MNAQNFFQQLVGIECWSVVGGSGPGSVISLGFGKKLARERPLQNENLTEAERLYTAEFGLMVFSAWRVSRQGAIVGGWRDSAPNSPVRTELDKLVGSRVETVNLDSSTCDLQIRFIGGMELQLFCDVTNDAESDENYFFSDSQWHCIVGINSLVSFERRNQES